MTKNPLSSYKQIANDIIKEIHDGTYLPGSYLPSENKLANKYNVTRTTVRKALSILKNKGTIESYQGKGYKVRLLHWEQSLLQFYSFGKNIADKIHNPSTQILSYKKIDSLKDENQIINDQLWEINRLRFMDQIPIILETSYIPVKNLPSFQKEDLKQHSLYTLLENNDIIIIKAKEYLKTTLASDKSKKLLEIKNSTPLFQTLRYTYDTNEELVEIRESLIRGDHFNFSVEMSL
ncbi:GntR family transcriptional regulator [Natronospora cellulosivora (SeqCode)]